MNRSHKRRVFIGFAVLGIALTAGSSSADHAWNNYHWARTSNPFTLLTGDNVDAKWDAYLIEAIADWNQSGVVVWKKWLAPQEEVPSHGRPDRGVQRGVRKQRLAGYRADLDQRRSHHAGHNETQRHLLQYRHLQHAAVAASRDVPGSGARLRARTPGRELQQRNLGSCMDYTSDPDGGGAFGPTQRASELA